MPTLILARHAKAEAPQAGLDDHSRALTMEGRDAAARLAERLLAADLRPNVALVSSANRTVQTFKRMASVLGDVELRIDEDLYESARERFISVLARVGDVQTVIVVGHEPTTSHVAAWLSGPGSLKRPLQRVAQGMPTSAAAVLELDMPWHEIGPKCARLVDVVEGKPE
ncbi:histidine phosphatase family protein [Demequina sp. TTPB684]|uniref:SixA phosphatase family protein n=1 Tax=unclassified Demequina TaxID=2620311 RepID=UPI001CF573F2|nr:MULTISPECIES: histidine phosphatase family protein [unclassified Demequina]MCB2413895.1 histidine phosphatase family protein [Demequina sp. TTPB684]UPU89417.1 histidine phosphatase family protein [Demequina sp. TMPB413]